MVPAGGRSAIAARIASVSPARPPSLPSWFQTYAQTNYPCALSLDSGDWTEDWMQYDRQRNRLLSTMIRPTPWATMTMAPSGDQLATCSYTPVCPSCQAPLGKGSYQVLCESDSASREEIATVCPITRLGWTTLSCPTLHRPHRLLLLSMGLHSRTKPWRRVREEAKSTVQASLCSPTPSDAVATSPSL